MPNWLSILAAVAIVISSALYFADRRMKTEDNHFRGFPGLWNAVAFISFSFCAAGMAYHACRSYYLSLRRS